MNETSSPQRTIGALLMAPVPLDAAALVLLTSTFWCSSFALMLMIVVLK